MIVESTVAGARQPSARDIDVPLTVATLRDLITVLVGHELASFAERQDAGQLLQVLTPADLARGVDTGVYGRQPPTRSIAPPPEVATQVALQGFLDGLFLVFVDGHPVETLDEQLNLRADSRLRLVRLVALTGG